MSHTAGILLIVGSVVFLIGAAIGVPRVFTEPDPSERLRMVTERLGSWRVAQPLYGLGPLIAAAGVGVLAATESDRMSQTMVAVACAATGVGGITWGWSLYLRGTRIREFAFGTLPGWPFVTYIFMTMAGLALLGIGFLAGEFPGWLGWLTLGADLVFLLAYLRFRDIPPFVFYLLFLAVGVGLV
jgi:hypothetical protein